MSLIQQIKQIYIPVKELDRAVQFYRDTLEVPFSFKQDCSHFSTVGAYASCCLLLRMMYL